MECSDYRGIKLMCHGMKLYERVVENRLSERADISNGQYGFQPGKSTIELIFTLRMTQEKYLEKQKERHLVFVDLEKAYDRLPRVDLVGTEKKGVEEVYVKAIQDMYTDCKTAMRTHAGTTASFEVGVGLHQGSAISPPLFIIIMDVIAENIDTTPQAMLFADDLVLCEEMKEEAEQQLEVWRNAMESRGLRVGRKQNTWYLWHPSAD